MMAHWLQRKEIKRTSFYTVVTSHTLVFIHHRQAKTIHLDRVEITGNLAIAETQQSQIRGLKMAVRNANDVISFVQTAEGGLEEVTNALQRMRELAVQAANGSYNTASRANLDAEFQNLESQIIQIAEKTEFNGTAVLNTASSFAMQVGFKEGVTVNVTGVSTNGGNVAAAITGTSITTVASATGVLTLLDSAIQEVTTNRATLGAKQNQLDSVVRNLENVIENVSAARSRIMDADFAAETAALTRAQILQQAGAAMLAQANAIPQNVLTLLR